MPANPWRPSRPVALLIGLLSLWPIVYFFLFLGVIAYTFLHVSTQGGTHDVPALFPFIIIGHLLTMLVMFALLAIYIIHAMRNDRLSESERILWIVILFFFGIFACPVYWFLYMWRQPAPAYAV